MKKSVWLGLAILLLLCAAYLMRPRPSQAPKKRNVSFPSRMTQPERERAKKRRTLLPPIRPNEASADKARPRDPMLVAIPPSENAVVVEANAIVNSRVGELILRCLQAEDPEGLAEFQEKSGIDPTTAIDRMAMSFGPDGEKVAVVSGHFEDLQLEELKKDGNLTFEPYGDHGLISERLALWKREMLLAGDPAGTKAAIDRLEGRAEPLPPAIADGETYGEIYGRVGTEFLGKLFGNPQLSAKLQDATSGTTIHVDTREDVAMSFEVKGKNEEGAQELAKMLGAALSVARVNAELENDEDLAELLEFAKVTDRIGNDFTLQVALPIEFIEEKLAECGKNRANRPGSAPAARPID